MGTEVTWPFSLNFQTNQSGSCYQQPEPCFILDRRSLDICTRNQYLKDQQPRDDCPRHVRLQLPSKGKGLWTRSSAARLICSFDPLPTAAPRGEATQLLQWYRQGALPGGPWEHRPPSRKEAGGLSALCSRGQLWKPSKFLVWQPDRRPWFRDKVSAPTSAQSYQAVPSCPWS